MKAKIPPPWEMEIPSRAHKSQHAGNPRRAAPPYLKDDQEIERGTELKFMGRGGEGMKGERSCKGRRESKNTKLKRKGVPLLGAVPPHRRRIGTRQTVGHAWALVYASALALPARLATRRRVPVEDPSASTRGEPQRTRASPSRR